MSLATKLLLLSFYNKTTTKATIALPLPYTQN